GDKRAYYTAIKNIREWRKEAYYKKIEEDIRQTRENLLRALKEIENDESEEAKKIRQRIEFALQRNATTEKIINIFLKHEDEEVLKMLLECLEEKLNSKNP
ncbi:MAG: GbsR/MarR family transcriptional regulator, partial [Thermococcus sp.]|nr:GbsR/MarR family transcriptional regulator [Thermococcus sp.]